ncbi:VWA domain-containing protein [bacterium]|nr:VWA domain-containing protein [bacterium]
MRKNFYIIVLFLFFALNSVYAGTYDLHSPNDDDIDVSSEKTLFILDFSSSMREYLNKERKVDSMLNTMRTILQSISPQKEVGMRVYGHRAGITPYDSCKASKLMVPITKGGNYLIKQQIEKTRALGMTPITYSLKMALYSDFQGFQGSKHIILLTDGGENCDESPCTFMTKNLKYFPNLKIDVIAYDMQDEDDLSQLQCVALVTKGHFYNANTSAELLDSLNNSLNIEKEVEGKVIMH